MMAKKLRQVISKDQPVAAKRIKQQFESHFSYDDLGILAFYWPMLNEADPRLIAKTYLDIHSGKICLPFTHNDRRVMDFHAWDYESPLKVGDMGILVPNADTCEIAVPDTLLVPMLLFNDEGHRIGFGRGNYDATLATLKKQKDIVTIGIAYDKQYWHECWAVDEYDVALDYIITPDKIYDFAGRKGG